MDTQQNQAPQNTEKLKDIPKWTCKYAQNRTLTTFLVIVITMLVGMVIAALSYLAGAAFIKGNMTVFRICIVVLFIMLVFVLIIRVSKFSGVVIHRWLDQLLYDDEGTALMPEPKSTKKIRWLGIVVGLVVGGCIIGTMFLGMEGYIAFKYMQPISALYLVPFLIHLYFMQRPRVGTLILICPILYTTHAILIIAGVPIFFTGYLCMLNLALPLFGYTFLTHLICHVYSRYALKKLKGLTHLEGEVADGD
jgi:hypothetical protein